MTSDEHKILLQLKVVLNNSYVYIKFWGNSANSCCSCNFYVLISVGVSKKAMHHLQIKKKNKTDSNDYLINLQKKKFVPHLHWCTDM